MNQKTEGTGAWVTGLFAITLFVEDLQAAKEFYVRVFGLPVDYEDENSAVFKFGDTLINLLKTTAARELVEPAQVASRAGRITLCLHPACERRGCNVRRADCTRSGTPERADGPPLGNTNRQLR